MRSDGDTIKLPWCDTEPKRVAIGVDLGGTKIVAALVDATGAVQAKVRKETPANQGVSAVIKEICDAAREVMQAAGVGHQEVSGVGVGAAGMTDSRKGVVILASNLQWKNVPLKRLVEERLGLPTFVDKDTNVAALGEQRCGAGQGVQHLLYVTVGTGVGGGIILNGEVYHGASEGAGEIGHIPLVPDGPRCGCGHDGCLETLASGPAMARRAMEAVRKGHRSHIVELAGGDVEAISAEIIAEAARDGDALAQEIFEIAGEYLGLGIAIYININNPQLVIIGGGVAEAGDLLFNPIRETVRKRALPLSAETAKIVPAMLGEDAGVIGAAILALEAAARVEGDLT